MKQPVLIVAALLALGLGVPMLANADSSELGVPLAELMPHVNRLGQALNLTAGQQTRLATWKAEAPARRKALETETLATRARLREAILSGADRMQREALKKRLAAQQTRLIEMRSLCTRMLRQTLDADQFARIVASYRAG